MAMRNIGPVSTQWLAAVGVHTLEDLERIGVVEAYLRAKDAFPDRVSLNLLWALQGAMLDLHFADLPPGMKEDLRRRIESASG